MIKIQGLEFAYDESNVLRNIDFSLRQGEACFLVGPNGSGKTTLLKCLNGILEPSGSVYLDGREIQDYSRREIARMIGYLPQRSGLSDLTVYDAVLLGRRPHIGWSAREGDYRVVDGVIESLDLREFAARSMKELSGGELQKVFIARALAQEPKTLFLDEPTSDLDIKNQIEIMNLLTEIVQKEGISALISMHDLNLASLYADRIVMLKEGEIVADGKTGVLTPENIEKVYEINVSVVNHNGKTLIIPEKIEF